MLHVDYGARLCHGSKSYSIAVTGGERIGGVSLLVSTTGSKGCVDGESLPTANSGFRISSPNSTTGLGPSPIHYRHSELDNACSHAQIFSVCTCSMCHKHTMRLVQKVTIIFVNTFMINVNIL